jgi:AcrR family transcriptional regulator
LIVPVKNTRESIIGYNMSSRMQRKKEKKRKAILDAAERIIAERGMAGMTMGQVAVDADVATGTLYLYFKNKGSLLAAVNSRINGAVNHNIKEKMARYQTGLEKVMASGTAVIEYCLGHPQQWKAVTELYQMKAEDLKDPNVRDFLAEVNHMVQMMAEAYRQGIEEGTIREDLDPIPTAIYNRMAFSNAFTPTTEQKMLLELNNINQERYVSVATDLISRSTRKVFLIDNMKKPTDNMKKPTS